jgi:hypothetical protein
VRLADKVSAKNSMIRLELWYSVEASGLDVNRLKEVTERIVWLPLDTYSEPPQNWGPFVLQGSKKTHEKEVPRAEDKGSAKTQQRGGRGH